MTALAVWSLFLVERPFRPWLGRIHWREAAAGVVPLIGLEGLGRAEMSAWPTSPPRLYEYLARQPRTVLAEWPMPPAHALPGVEPQHLYFSQFHPHRLLNGYSGFYPDRYLRRAERLDGFPACPAVAELADSGARLLVLHSRHHTPEAFRRLSVALRMTSGVSYAGRLDDWQGVADVFRLSERIHCVTNELA